ncbi:hypothetical protein M9Y10_038641 [Tritrichomonas musculus]|uniref:Gamma-glutamylcyclotransferase AIG2-like domain-containing protein n=1 Tax=Tritrichomonas musculus TaxID=1915356 RepID=A0ABR2K8Z9_9EUKA
MLSISKHSLLSSQQVYKYLYEWKDYGGKEQLCFRELDKDLDDDNEYQGFVYENKLSAITQYDNFGRFDDIIKTKDKVGKMIHEFWQSEVKPRMKVDHYIVDFDYVNNKIILIEVSPFLRTTGAGVLSLDDDAFELRYGSGKLKVASKTNPNADRIARSFEEQWEDATDYKDNFIKERGSDEQLKEKEDEYNYIFVGSVLKKGFFWNQKYLSYAEYINQGELVNHSILIDDNEMSLIVKGGYRIKGELWKVTNDDLRDIEYFYGKECQKEEVSIKTSDGKEYKNALCFVYVEPLKEGDKIMEEYTVDNGKDFNNIAYEERKQEKYSNISYNFPLEEDEK